MKTTFTTIAAATALVCTASNALAQTAMQRNFIGPSIGVTVTASQNKVSYESTVGSINGQSSQTNDPDYGLLGSWGFAVSPNWVATVGLAYSAKAVDMGNINYTAGGAQTVSVKGKEHIAISLAPGYRVDAETLVYTKFSYNQIKGDYTDTATAGGTTNHTGTGVGLGLALAVSQNMELRAEYETIVYSAERVGLTAGRPTQSGLTFGVLYKF